MDNRRSRAREVVLQLLFQHDLNSQPFTLDQRTAFAQERMGKDKIGRDLSLRIFHGVIANREAIDKTIAETAENWKLHRMLPVDRNLLRLATYEMLHMPDRTPPSAAITQAMELSRRYGSPDSPAFVNGILDKIAKTQVQA